MDSPRKETSYEEEANLYNAQEEYKQTLLKAARLKQRLKEAGILVD